MSNNGRIAVSPKDWRDARDILVAARPCLKRWSARYAGSDHAKKHVIETAQLVERIDEWLLRR
jgi:hypothetical protein